MHSARVLRIGHGIDYITLLRYYIRIKEPLPRYKP